MIEVGWITFHRWLFDSEQAAGALTIPAPAGAAWWHFGADSPVGPDGFRTGRGRSWAGTGFFADRAAADRVLDDPAAQFPDLPAHAEAFHCLLRPIRFWATAAGWPAPMMMTSKDASVGSTFLRFAFFL